MGRDCTTIEVTGSECIHSNDKYLNPFQFGSLGIGQLAMGRDYLPSLLVGRCLQGDRVVQESPGRQD